MMYVFYKRLYEREKKATKFLRENQSMIDVFENYFFVSETNLHPNDSNKNDDEEYKQ